MSSDAERARLSLLEMIGRLWGERRRKRRMRVGPPYARSDVKHELDQAFIDQVAEAVSQRLGAQATAKAWTKP